MAKYIKHNSNYIKTVRHQFLKDGSTIYERDWVTVGSQLNFGPGKIPYYNDGNFIFTTSPTPFYQKKYKNGVLVGVWTYEDVKDASNVVNKINLDEHTEDIRSYAYYGSCLELVRVSIENIINTFPGNITVSDEELGVFKTVDEFVCGGEDVEEKYVRVKKNNKLCFTLNNPFDINIFLKDVQLTEYDNPLHYLTHSFKDYQISTNGGQEFVDITKYKVVMRQMYEKEADPCTETIKEHVGSVTFSGVGEIQSITLPKGNYFIEVNNQQKLNNWVDTCYKSSDAKCFSISYDAKSVKTDENGNVKLVLSNNSEQQINGVTLLEESLTIDFYKETRLQRVYKYYQMFDDVEYENTFKAQKWVKSTCFMNFWLPDSVFLNRCDEFQRNVLYSEISNIGENQPVYTVTINDTIKIEGYIYNGQVIPLVVEDYEDLVIQPKEEVIEEYFDNLEGFEKQLLTRKTKPLYLNRFVTPIEYNLGYLYYKRTYTWPSNGYCIDITSPRYIDFVNRLSNMAQLYDELWTDNLWRRMTHEAIKNYDWTYTREFEEGEEQDNVDGGERMHKVLNVIARVFDDIKRTIDTVKRNNRVTYDGDRNIPNALLSDKLELRGWDIYSTINTYEVTETVDDETITKNVPASEDTITEDFLNEEYITKKVGAEDIPKWYPTLEPINMTFADVDNQFMRRLLLSTRRIFETKGTKHGIDMIMGMFGYGNMDEQCYEIKEEYYIVTPREYDEAVGVDELGDTESLGDRIVRLNTLAKQSQLLYDEDASGIPVGSFAVFEKNPTTQEQEPTTYLIPFYNQNKVYDGDLYFQTRGGWFYNGSFANGDDIDAFKWTETLSYLHVASQVGDLLSVNPNGVGIGDIYYVANLNDYLEYTEEPLYSNFFVLEDDYNPDKFSSWTNLNLEDDWYDNTTVGYTDEEIEKYKYYVKKAKYLDSIIPYTIGNNPHVGYGKYDMGNEYLEYMKQPFKYTIDGENFDTVEHKEEAENITFEFQNSGEPILDDEKIQIIANGVDTTTINDYGGIKELEYSQYKLNEIKELIKKQYYINCKVIHFKNLIVGDNYKMYFRNVIMKYLMQLIPSTTIFVLENFELDSEHEESDGKISVLWRYANGNSVRQKVDPGTSVEQKDGLDWSLTPQGEIISSSSWPYRVDAPTTFYQFVVITYTVHFLYANGTETTQEVAEGGHASNSGQWCLRGGTDIVNLSTYAITTETWFVEVVMYSVKFYDTNGTTIIHTDNVRSGEQVDTPDDGTYYYKGDKSRVGSFPHAVYNDEEFVKFAVFNVRFIDNGTPIDTQQVRDGLTARNPGGLWSLQSDGGGSTVNISSYIIEHDTTFYRWVAPIVYYTVTFVDKNGNQIADPQAVEENGTATNPRPGSDWYEQGVGSISDLFNFNTPITHNTRLVLVQKFTVKWVDNGDEVE